MSPAPRSKVLQQQGIFRQLGPGEDHQREGKRAANPFKQRRKDSKVLALGKHLQVIGRPVQWFHLNQRKKIEEEESRWCQCRRGKSGAFRIGTPKTRAVRKQPIDPNSSIGDKRLCISPEKLEEKEGRITWFAKAARQCDF